MPIKPFQTNEYLQARLERLSGVEFSPNTIKLLNTEGYYRTKAVISFMKDHKLQTKNLNIQTLYRREKHLRHMIMPRIETFELQLSYAILIITSKITEGNNIFDDIYNLFIKNKTLVMCEKIKKTLRFSFGEDFDFNGVSVFDYFPYLSLGNLIHIYKNLKPRYKIMVLKKAFNITISPDKTPNTELKIIKQNFDVVLKLRNSIAHGTQLLKKKGMYIEPFIKSGLETYTEGLANFMQECKFKELFINTKTHINFFNDFLKKIQFDLVAE